MKREKRSITGVLLLDKPMDISSNAALTRTRILYAADKAGHTGTLDPFATGLLPICLGEATKFAGYMLDADKTYEATIRLGRTTATGDPESDVLTESPVEVTPADAVDVLGCFTGRISQTPPMYSAIKFQGQPLYRMARRGVNVPRQKREITIHRLELLAFESPLLKVRVVCSKGTYVRVLAEDIGNALGCGGMLENLRRTHTGSFDIADALTLEQLGDMSLAERDSRLAGPDRLVWHLPEMVLDAETGQSLLEGRSSQAPFGQSAGVYRSYDEARAFLGLVEADVVGVIRPKRMMSRSLCGMA